MKDQNTPCLGDLVAAAYDVAGSVAQDEPSRSALAACAVRRMLLRAGRSDLARLFTEPVKAARAAVRPLRPSLA